MDDEAILAAGMTLARHARSPARVVLFGSRARGEEHATGDLDFLVIEERVDDRLGEMVRLRDSLADLDVAVDIVVVSRAEARQRALRPGSLVRRALAESRVIVDG